MTDLIAILTSVAASAWHVLPFFAVSIVLGAAVHTWDHTSTSLRRRLTRRPLAMILIASALGTLSPFCSCGVIPVIAGLLTAGVPLAPVMAFWISSPLMSPEAFVITYAELGWSFAVARTLAAFLLGVIAGSIGLLLRKERHVQALVLAAPAPGFSCGGSCAVPTPKARAFVSRVLTLTRSLGQWLLLAFFLEALIVRYVPTTWIVQLLGTHNQWSIPMAALVGIPLYVNTYSAIPIVAGLLAKGMAPGAALSFLIAGPATSIPAIMAVTAIARKYLLLLYIAISFLGAITAGYVYQVFLSL